MHEMPEYIRDIIYKADELNTQDFGDFVLETLKSEAPVGFFECNNYNPESSFEDKIRSVQKGEIQKNGNKFILRITASAFRNVALQADPFGMRKQPLHAKELFFAKSLYEKSLSLKHGFAGIALAFLIAHDIPAEHASIPKILESVLDMDPSQLERVEFLLQKLKGIRIDADEEKPSYMCFEVLENEFQSQASNSDFDRKQALIDAIEEVIAKHKASILVTNSSEETPAGFEDGQG